MRRKVTRGTSNDIKEEGNSLSVKTKPDTGGDPEEPSATSLVYNWASFFAPVSISRALEIRLRGDKVDDGMTYHIS